MVTKFYQVLLLMLWANFTFGQQNDTIPERQDNSLISKTDTSGTESGLNKVTKTKIVLGNTNEADWKSGKAKYPPKPKHMWELGLGVGHYFIHGDVDPKIPGYGLSLHMRRAINYSFSFRLDFFYGTAFGLEPQPYTKALEVETSVFQGYGTQNAWFPAYKTQYYYGAIEGILNIGNILFHKDRNKWNSYLILGAGLDHNNTKLDLRDENGNVYTNLISLSEYSDAAFNTRQGRIDIKKKLRGLYDGDYETPAFKKKGIFRLNDKTNIHPIFIVGVGISRKINRRINIALEHQVHFSDNDYLDGIIYRSDVDQTTQNDYQHYTNLRLNINLGKFKKRKEPLYWLNPLDAAFTDIADLKRRPIFDPKDTDQDGVIDLLDQENETPAGAPVDPRGIALDSDNDGIPDHKDAEPFSPPGFQVNEKGIAQVPVVQPGMSEDDVKRIVDNRLGVPPGAFDSTGGKGLLSNIEWFLPMIHFKLDEYCIDLKFVPQLASVAHVMQTHPSLKVTVFGHTDIRHSNAYNKVLSYNRANEAIEYLVNTFNIPRNRFKLMYGGEESPLGGHNKNYQVNRRVEFKISQPDDVEMPKPDGPKAGACHKTWSRKSTTESKEAAPKK
ncbi:MAG TPA: OmpA family protein [Saprospiraceae bacterium]|nr:OmpA family protein [Saprospiraceae bacterium]